MNALPIDRVQEIFACLDGHCSVRETARRARVARNTAARYTHLWRRARIRGNGVIDEGETLAVRPSRRTVESLAAAAMARGMSRSDLVAELLEAIAEDDLVDSVLVGGAA